MGVIIVDKDFAKFWIIVKTILNQELLKTLLLSKKTNKKSYKN
jgi:hypothetical protein